MQKWVNFKFFLSALFLLFAISASAGEIEPRSYVNTPIDINVAVAGYVYSDGGLAISDASSLQDANLKMDTEYWLMCVHLMCAGIRRNLM